MDEIAVDEECILEALHSCPPLCTHLGLQGLACLADCSRTLEKECVFSCRRDAAGLTACAIEALDTVQGRQQKQQLEAVAWLLRKVPAAATPSLTDKLLGVRHVPLACAEALVAAGVRVSYAQLLAAAYSMVAGVEVWVQAQDYLGVRSDIPESAISVCCSNTRVSCFQGFLLLSPAV
jgi:hypothetical protein